MLRTQITLLLLSLAIMLPLSARSSLPEFPAHGLLLVVNKTERQTLGIISPATDGSTLGAGGAASCAVAASPGSHPSMETPGVGSRDRRAQHGGYRYAAR
jgi:hypothetical protein